jgi:UDP-N-acetylmuramoyl-tripeptide--D-alanyl-D-alanine ligase
MTAGSVAAVAIAVVATALADLRWLRVAQREHYLAGSATRFALRWWLLGPNRVLGLAAVVGVAVAPVSPYPVAIGMLAVAIGPFRYRLRGRSPGPVVWTPRLRTVAASTGAVQVALVAAGVALGAGVAVAGIVALLAPVVVDLALAALKPVEDRKAAVFVERAARQLEAVAPTIVGITGSFGKTTTKMYAAHLIRGARTVVATPASFNNRAGLSRAINEHLAPGTDVFIAEMGTYGRGEIAALCEWCPPRVAAITAIGPVHLERFGSEDAIVAAKAEILAGAEVAVLNVDDQRLAALRPDAKVVRCSSTDATADVCATAVDGRLVVTVAGERIADVPDPGVSAGNVAIAVAIALAVDAPTSVVAAALQDLPVVPNRRARTTLSTGAIAVDDTFNSNPAGSRAALDELERLSTPDGKRVVVTPGMVELGPVQAGENATFAEAAASRATHVVLVGLTNRRALLAGVERVPTAQRAKVMLADDHERAVEWVRESTGPGDVVLYENQLPDHYP